MQIFDFKKYPALFTVIPLIAGILFSYLLKENIYYTGLNLILIQLVLFVLTIYFISKTKSINSKFYYLLFFAVFFTGFFRFNYFYSKYDESNIAVFIDDSKDANVKLYGKVIEQPDIEEDRIKLILETDSIRYFRKSIIVTGNVSASIYKNKFEEDLPERIMYGDQIEVSGSLQKLPHRRNPGEFDYGEYLKLHGIDAMFTAYGFEGIKLIEHTGSSFVKQHVIIPVKEYSIKVIDSLVGGEEGEFLKGLVLGERSNISKEVKEDFVNAGVSHIIAVSGLNVAYLTIILMVILQLFPIKHVYKTIIIFCFLIFYMNLTGNVPSIVRATIMASVFLMSQLLERKTSAFNVISVAAIAILVIDPRQLFDAGFILSFWAIISIVFIYPKLHELISQRNFYQKIGNEKYKGRIIKAAIALFLGTLAAQIGTLPVTALMFKKISVVSLITNLFAIPFSNIALGLGFGLIIFSTFTAYIASLIADAAFILLHYMLVSFDYFSSFSFSFFETYSLDYLFLIIFYAVIITLLFIPQIKVSVRIIIVALLIINYFIFSDLINSNDKLRLTYLDVGNSNACLITTPGNKNVLIGCGTSTTKYNTAERNIIPYLKMQGIDKIDIMIIPSLNKDEFRNLRELARTFKIGKLYVPSHFKKIFENDDIGFSLRNNKLVFIGNPLVIKNDAIRIYCYYDTALTTGKTMYVDVKYGSNSFLFSEAKDLYDINYFETLISNNCTVLKVPYSGSYNYVSPESIIKLNPQYIIISSSARKKKRLNSDIFETSLKNFGYDMYDTGDRGAVILESNGEKTEVIEWN